MDEGNAGKLQIYSVEERDSAGATCIVRCVGGIARVGQQFDVASAVDSSGNVSSVTLDWLKRYERPMDFVDPPHNAKVHFSGAGVTMLKAGVIVTSVESREA